jgi:hypothetical protein
MDGFLQAHLPHRIVDGVERTRATGEVIRPGLELSCSQY